MSRDVSAGGWWGFWGQRGWHNADRFRVKRSWELGFGAQGHEVIAYFLKAGDFFEVFTGGHVVRGVCVDLMLQIGTQWFDHAKPRRRLVVEQAALGITSNLLRPISSSLEVKIFGNNLHFFDSDDTNDRARSIEQRFVR